MTLKHPFLDYEPVRRLPFSPSAGEQTVDDKSDPKDRKLLEPLLISNLVRRDAVSAHCEDSYKESVAEHALRWFAKAFHEPQEARTGVRSSLRVFACRVRT